MSRTTLLALLALSFVATPAAAQGVPSREDQTVQSATAVLNEIMAVQVTRIPQYMLADAKGVAIVPNVIKGGFVVGVRHGRGVLLVRDGDAGWQPPVFVSLTGGSFGWQAGVQATDVILVFKTEKSVQGLMRGKFTLGVDAAAAAGPVGREAQAATDATLRAEIYSYSRSRGLFAGVSLDGSALQIDEEANRRYYAALPQQAGVPQIPASAVKLMSTLAQYTLPAAGTGPVLEPVPEGVVAGEPTPAVAPPGVSKAELAEASQRLAMILDDSWRRYLALPAEIYTSEPVNVQSLRLTVERFDRVAADGRYRALTQRGEFRALHELLHRYQQTLAAQPENVPSLPPPPTE